MRQATVDDSGRAAARIDGYQDAINFDLAEGFDHNAMMQREHCPPIMVASDEGNFVILDDTSQRYSGTQGLNFDSDANLEGCLRILQSIVGRVRPKAT